MISGFKSNRMLTMIINRRKKQLRKNWLTCLFLSNLKQGSTFRIKNLIFLNSCNYLEINFFFSSEIAFKTISTEKLVLLSCINLVVF